MNKLNFLQGLAVAGITATTIAAIPAQASTLGWSNGTSDFFSDVNPGGGDTFSVTFSPDDITLISTATGIFSPPFDAAPPPYIATATAEGDFQYVSGGSGLGATGVYELTSPLTFTFSSSSPALDNDVTVTWATGTQFEYLFDTVNDVEFALGAGQDLPTVTGINFGEEFLLGDSFEFSDGSLADGGVYAAEIEATGVPEPGSILGLLAVGGLGLGLKRKKQS